MIKSKREKSEFTEIFEQFLKTYSEFSEISEIARRNTYDMGRSAEARIWIIGGFVYRPIIRALYGEIPEPSQIDIDFLIERPPASENLYFPEGWTPSVTRSGYPYLDKGKIRIDLNYLSSFHSIIARQLSPPRLEHFFTGTPMNIQSIAYDLTGKTVGVIGKHGIVAIKNKIVQINNLEEAIFESEKRGMILKDFVREKAEELGFSWDLTPIHQIPDIEENHKENGKIPVRG
ncbi:MAG: hypothetical protein AABW93_00840 [Nanoarchaeota archaeon]